MAHLAGGGGIVRHGLATHHPAHGRITSQPVGVVNVFVTCQAPEHELAKLSDQPVASILAGPGVGENLSREVRQAEGIIEVPNGEQPSVGRHLRTVEL
jgi:hypothetical protein